MRAPVAGAAVPFLLVALTCAVNDPSGESARRAARGREVYLSEGCVSCHGRDRQGTRTAPPLTRLRRHWRAEQLVRYLRSPATYPADSRLQRLSERYPGGMAGLPLGGEEAVRDLVAFLLSR